MPPPVSRQKCQRQPKRHANSKPRNHLRFVSPKTRSRDKNQRQAMKPQKNGLVASATSLNPRASGPPLSAAQDSSLRKNLNHRIVPASEQIIRPPAQPAAP